jgi:hypothetical protein
MSDSKIFASVARRFPIDVITQRPEPRIRNFLVLADDSRRYPSRSGSRKESEMRKPTTKTDNAVLAISKNTEDL